MPVSAEGLQETTVVSREWRCPHGVVIGRKRADGSIWAGNSCPKCQGTLSDWLIDTPNGAIGPERTV